VAPVGGPSHTSGGCATGPARTRGPGRASRDGSSVQDDGRLDASSASSAARAGRRGRCTRARTPARPSGSSVVPTYSRSPQNSCTARRRRPARARTHPHQIGGRGRAAAQR
jgi:hypothetical protein